MRHGFPKRFFVALSLVASLATFGCGRTATSNDAPPADPSAAPPADPSAAPAATEPKPAAPRALAEATNATRTLHVAVLQARRVQDTVRVELAFTYTLAAAPTAAGATPTPASQPQSQPQSQSEMPPAPEPLSLLRALASDGGHATADANPADFCLLTADGARRLFLLHDSQNKPVLEGDWQKPLHAAERRVLAATFPAPPAIPVRVTLVLGRLVLRDVPIS